MKLNAQAVDDFCHYPQKYAGALVYGADEGQVRQRVNQLCENWPGKGNPPAQKLEYMPADFTGDDSKNLADICASMNLLSGKQVIVVRDATDALVPLLDEALACRADDNFLILSSTEPLAIRSKLRIWAEKERALGVVACYIDEGRALTQLISQTLRGYGLRADHDAIHFLADHLGGDRQIILNELEKLSLYLGDAAELLTLEDAMMAVGYNSAGSLDALYQAVASGDVGRACQLSDTMLLEGVSSVVMIRSVTRYFHRLEQLAELRQTGLGLDAAIEALQPKVFFKHKPMMRQHGARWGKNRIVAAEFVLQALELNTKRHHDQASLYLGQGWIRLAQLASAKPQKIAA